jgi:hypothetical protein
VTNRTFRASLEALEDRLAPAHLSLLSPPAEHGLALGHSFQAARLESTPSPGASVELKTPLLSQSLQTNLTVTLSETSLVSTGLHVSLGTFVLSQPLLTLKTDVTVGSDAPTSGGVGVSVGVSGQTPVGTVDTGGGGIVAVINPTPAPVQQLPSVTSQPAFHQTLPFVSSQAALVQAVNPNAATAAALTATDNASANLLGRAQPAFLLQPVSTGAASSSLIPAGLAPPEVSGQAPSGGRLAKPDAGFSEGGGDELDQLGEPDLELPPAPQRQDVPDVDAAPAILELSLAGAAPAAGFVPGFSDDGGKDEAAPLLQAGLGDVSDLSSWLVFAVAVSGLAVARLAAPQPRRRRGQDLFLLADESIS